LVKKLLFFVTDLFAITLAWFGAYWLRFSFDIPQWFLDQALNLFPLILAIQVSCLLFFRLYRLMPHFTSLPDLVRILAFTTCSVAFSSLAIFYWKMPGFKGFPRSIPALDLLLLILFITGWRILPRLFREQRLLGKTGKRAVIIGAGQAGEMLVRDIARQGNSDYLPVAFVDDDTGKKGRLLHGIPIIGPIKDLPSVCKDLHIETAIIAIPSASKKTIQAIVELCDKARVDHRILPSTNDIISGKVTVSDIRRITIEDLLGREAIPPRKDLLEACIRNKTVMVTGAGGSIGSELSRQVCSLGASKIILFEHSEFALYKIESELRENYGKQLKIVPILGSVCNFNRVRTAISVFEVDTIYHAAAYKHVPLVEFNPIEGIHNNFFGTLNTALAALECGVKTFLLISTDKAVRPTNIMGASKRLSEMALQALAKHGDHKTVFTMVRFGNVLGSSGSVVPLFRKQIRTGGPVTVTHPEITRYFMTIPEAVQLVIQAGSMASGGEIFVLDMGEPVRIVDLARKMIRLSGLSEKTEDNPDGDIEIKFTGLRPGEKLYEELLIGGNVTGTSHPMIMKTFETFVEWRILQKHIKILHSACKNMDLEHVRQILEHIIEGYKPQCGLVDPVWLASGSQKSESMGTRAHNLALDDPSEAVEEIQENFVKWKH